MTPDELRAKILYRDGSILVIDKPAGLAVHPGPKTKESLESYLPALRFGLDWTPRLVHRLDRDTSGCLVLARHERAVRKLGRLFSSAAVKKCYWAIVEGAPEQESGLIDLALAKITSKAGWRMVPDQQGQRAMTEYRVLGQNGGTAWLELRPQTGRTHQLRVHCASSGFPVLGDPVYGRAPKPSVPLHLHARMIVIPRAESEPITVAAEPPVHMRAALAACGYVAEPPEPENPADAR